MKKITIVFMSLFMGLSSSYGASENLDTNPNINGWGFDVSFGSQPYTDYSTRISVLTPHLFDMFNDLSWRLTGDFIGRTIQGTDDAISEFALSLESNSKIYKDVVYSFAKFGVSVWSIDEDIYDDTLISVPLSFGLQVVTRNTENFVLSYFIDYRFSLFNNFEEDDAAVTALDKEVLLSGSTSFGLRMTF